MWPSATCWTRIAQIWDTSIIMERSPEAQLSHVAKCYLLDKDSTDMGHFHHQGTFSRKHHS